jgi:hypothetical protein
MKCIDVCLRKGQQPSEVVRIVVARPLVCTRGHWKPATPEATSHQSEGQSFFSISLIYTAGRQIRWLESFQVMILDLARTDKMTSQIKQNDKHKSSEMKKVMFSPFENWWNTRRVFQLVVVSEL